MGAERSYSRDQNNNVTSTNQPESIIVHCCLGRRETEGEIWACWTDIMSSPSPGKRRIDTDVIKLYPYLNLRVILSQFVLFSAGKLRAKMALAWWSFCIYGMSTAFMMIFLDEDFIRIESKHEVTILGGLNEFIVKFFGPSGCKFKLKIHMFSVSKSRVHYTCFHSRSVLVQWEIHVGEILMR